MNRIDALWFYFRNRSEIYPGDVEFFVVLCADVLLELMQYGDRRQLIKSERIGGRFHRLIEAYFRKKPFIRMDLRLSFVYLFITINNIFAFIYFIQFSGT